MIKFVPSHYRCETMTSTGYTNEAVEEQRCYGQEKPQDRRRCYSPCVGECVVSEWSAWSNCKQVISFITFKTSYKKGAQ